MKYLFSTVILITVAITACNKGESSNSNEANNSSQVNSSQIDAVPVEVIELKGELYREFGEYVGQVEPQLEVKLVAYAGGRVTKLFKDRGDPVKKGEALCKIEGDKYQASYESAKLSEKLARNKAERMTRHQKQGTASRTQADQAQMEFLTARQMRLEAEKIKHGAFCITPFDGTVVDRKVKMFDETSPGQATFFVANTNRIKITVGVPETEIGGYRTGSEAFIKIKGALDGEQKGTISSISQRVDDLTRTFPVELSFSNPDGRYKAGMTARIRMLRYNFTNRIVIPTESILVLAQDNAVMVIEGDKAKKRKIHIASTNKTQSLIDKGLSVGDRLIVKGQMQAVDGSLVKIIP